jgi:AcrR family transcriptional regulator
MTTVDRLLDAVDAVIAEHGPSGVTLRRVGTEAGLSHTAAAHYFRNKSGLFTTYITRAYAQVASGIEAAMQTNDPRAAMLEAADSYAQFAQSNPSAFAVMTRLELVNVDTAELWQARERGYFALAAILERSQQQGWADDRDLIDLIAITWGLVHGIVDLWCGGPLQAPYDGNELRPTLQRLLNGVLDDLNR